MHEAINHAAPPVRSASPALRLLLWLTHALALIGGLVLVAMILVSVVSVLGRWLMSAPIQGDYELIQLGCAICVACFLPYCQLQRGHVIVDFFTLNLSAGKRAVLDGFAAILVTLGAGLITWRLARGAWDVKAAMESTMLLAVPVWWAYVPMVIAFAVLTAVAAHTAWTELSASRQPA